MTSLKLTYFDFSGGRAEPARLAMHLGGISFEDHRFAYSEFPEIRKTTPLNQVPVLEIDGLKITQSDAITRYVGKLAGLYPEDPMQALLCDETMGALEDLTIKIAATFGLDDAALKAARQALVEDTIPRYLRWLQHQLEAHGGHFLADNRLTVADLKALSVLGWLGSGKLDHIPATVVETVSPGLKTYADRIAATPAIADYYAAR
jgi:glutathione S-transferase